MIKKILGTLISLQTRFGHFLIDLFSFLFDEFFQSAKNIFVKFKSGYEWIRDEIYGFSEKSLPIKLDAKDLKKKVSRFSKKSYKQTTPLIVVEEFWHKIKEKARVLLDKLYKAIVLFAKNLWFEFSNFVKALFSYLKRILVSFLQTLLWILRLPLLVFRVLFSKSLLLFLSGTLFALLFIAIPYEIYVLAQSLPATDLLVEKGNRRSTKILDRNGSLLYEIYEDRKYEPVELDQIPEHVIQATLAIEDDRFFEHEGYRVDSIMRAAKAIVMDDDLQGGSTITQQLVKNVLLTPERTISRKLKEIILSVLVENKYSKEQILELYLNNISYGGTSWGIEAASQKFFNKHVWEIDLAEASMLAGLPSAPSAYSPLNTSSFRAKTRQEQVLGRMVSLGYISESDSKEASQKELEYASQEQFIRAPHFVFYVRSILEEKYGSRFVTFGGLTVKTSLDLDLQQKVQDMVREGVEEYGYLNLNNGAAVVLDAETGEILAYVGSVDFFEEEWGAYDVVTANRQPGSSIKPVTYALALSDGMTPATVIDDSPTSFEIPGQKPYRPVNYDGKFRGKVTLREALASSYNIPAVKVVRRVGPDRMVSLARDMGLNSWDVEDVYGLSVTLGGKEVKLIEHANVFATLARQGTYKPVQPFLSIKDSKGREIIEDKRQQDQKVLDSGVAYLITSILSDNNARAPAFGYRSPLYIPGEPVAVKTGTTDHKRDNWTLGYSPSFVVGVWVGNNDNTPMNRYLASGLTGAAPIWNNIMTEVLEGETQTKFNVPDSVFLKVDEKCNRREYFLKGSQIPEDLCPKEEKDDKDDNQSES